MTQTRYVVREDRLLLRSRPLAWGILAAVLVLGTLFGTGRSVTALRQEVTEAFYVGTDQSGYGVATNLSLRIEYARNLCKIAADYDTDAERAAVEAACVALESAESFSEKYDANTALTDAVDTLDRRLQQLELTQEDESYRKSLTADIDSYQMKLDKLAVSFNSSVRSFNQDILGSFPVNVLRIPAGLEEVEEYS